MKTCFFKLAAGMAVILQFVTARGEIMRTVEREFSTQTFAGVYVETTSGNVKVTAGDGARVRVVARQFFARAASGRDADTAARRIDFEVAQINNDVVASAISSGRDGALVRVDFEVIVPPASVVDIRTGGRGNVTVGDLSGVVRVRAEDGAVRIGEIAGVVDVRTDGAISLGSATRLATLETQGGDVECGPVGGSLDVVSRRGHIRLSEMAGGVVARTDRGNISARITGVARRECALSAVGGSVALETGSASALLLDAYARNGRVYAHDDNLPIELIAGGPGKARLAGRINGSIVAAGGQRGALVKVRTAGGDIDLTPASVPARMPAAIATNRLASAD